MSGTVWLTLLLCKRVVCSLFFTVSSFISIYTKSNLLMIDSNIAVSKNFGDCSVHSCMIIRTCHYCFFSLFRIDIEKRKPEKWNGWGEINIEKWKKSSRQKRAGWCCCSVTTEWKQRNTACVVLCASKEKCSLYKHN